MRLTCESQMHASSLRTYHSSCARPVMVTSKTITSPFPEVRFSQQDIQPPVTTAEHTIDYCTELQSTHLINLIPTNSRQHTWRFFFLWKTMDFALTFLSLISTLLPHNTIGMFSHTRTRSLCQLGTFL